MEVQIFGVWVTGFILDILAVVFLGLQPVRCPTPLLLYNTLFLVLFTTDHTCCG